MGGAAGRGYFTGQNADNRPRMIKIPFTAILLAVLVSLAVAAPAFAASELFIRGGGYGHGVGMSQYGAYGYALHGADYPTILAHYYTGTALGTVDPNQVVTVLIATGRAAFSGARSAGGVKLNPAAVYDVRTLANGRLRLLDGKGKTLGSFPAPLTATGSGPLSVPGHGSYRGSLQFRPDGSGRVETIDAVGLDDYVRGVVAAEMPSGWSIGALEAQAIAARTYAITTDSGGAAFDQYSDTRSQMYGGVAAETPRTDAAVAATRGIVVTYRGRPVVTYFFSSSGGYTENNENVWQGSTPGPWLRGVSDPYDDVAGNPYFRWRSKLNGAQAAAKLGSLIQGRLIGIAPRRSGVSSRIISAVVVGTRGTRTVSGAQLEQLLGLDSTLVSFRTITTVAGPPGSGAAPPSLGGGAVAGPMVMLVPVLRALVAHAASLPYLVGTVFPAVGRARIAVQVNRGGRWRTILHTRLGSGGGYSVHPSAHGSYRIVYYGLDGPAVTL
ncbi:MAG TPA: SpoIID/LytB domain-containing protein [Solirubrobacteraceae bacterium]